MRTAGSTLGDRWAGGAGDGQLPPPSNPPTVPSTVPLTVLERSPVGSPPFSVSSTAPPSPPVAFSAVSVSALVSPPVFWVTPLRRSWTGWASPVVTGVLPEPPPVPPDDVDVVVVEPGTEGSSCGPGSWPGSGVD